MNVFTNILTTNRLAAFFAAFCLLACLLTSCEAERSTEELGQDEVIGDGFSLELCIGFDDLSSGFSRTDPEPAVDPALPTTYGTAFENTIKTLTLFVYNAAGELIEASTLDSNSFALLPFTAQSENHYLYITKQIENIPYGTYTVYVAANLSPLQVEKFKSERQNAGEYYELSGDHLNIAEELTSSKYGMAMSCVDPKSFDYTPSKTGGQCTFNLKRITAKVIVTAKTTDSSNKLVFVDSDNDGLNDAKKFIVRLEDVTYTVNSINKRTFLYQRGTASTDVKPYVMDPNINMLETNVENQFVYKSMSSWTNFLDYFKTVKAYVPNKYQYENESESVKYITENTFEVPSDATGISLDMQVTHLIVRAKIIPLSLKVTKGLRDFASRNGVGAELYNIIKTAEDAADVATPDDMVYTVSFTNPDYSELICELSLMYEEFDGAVSNSTFFMKDGDPNKDIYTYSAAKYVSQSATSSYVVTENNTVKLTGFNVYNDGYANYPVYISDPRTKLEVDEDNPWKRSQIFRNTYYILCIEKFTAPGQGLDPTERFIEVHTEVVPYKNSWEGIIDIDDETNVATP